MKRQGEIPGPRQRSKELQGSSLSPEQEARNARIHQAFKVLMGDPQYRQDIQDHAGRLYAEHQSIAPGFSSEDQAGEFHFGDAPTPLWFMGISAEWEEYDIERYKRYRNPSGELTPMQEEHWKYLWNLTGDEKTILDVMYDRVGRVVPEAEQAQSAFAEMIEDMPVLNPSRVVEAIWGLGLNNWQYTKEFAARQRSGEKLVSAEQLIAMRNLYPEELTQWTIADAAAQGASSSLIIAHEVGEIASTLQSPVGDTLRVKESFREFVDLRQQQAEERRLQQERQREWENSPEGRAAAFVRQVEAEQAARWEKIRNRATMGVGIALGVLATGAIIAVGLTSGVGEVSLAVSLGIVGTAFLTKATYKGMDKLGKLMMRRANRKEENN